VSLESLQAAQNSRMDVPTRDSKPSPFNEVASVLKSAVSGGIDMNGLKSIMRSCDARSVTRKWLPQDGVDCFVVDDVLSGEECGFLVEKAEKLGFSFWDERIEKKTAFRNADTVEVVQDELAEFLWGRLKGCCDEVVVADEDEEHERWQRDLIGEWEPCGTNRNILFARYRQGGHFAPHTDGFSIESCDKRSMYSIVLFLNDCKEGGGTRFFEQEQKEQLVLDDAGRFVGTEDLTKFCIEPKAGRAVIFFHNIVHQGVPVGVGSEKYIIRSDVMFRRRNPVCKTERDREAFQLYQAAQEKSIAGQSDEAIQMFRKAFKMSPVLSDLYGM